MKTYKATQNYITYYKNYESLKKAKEYFDTVLVGNYELSLAADWEQIPELTLEQKLQLDIQFGNQLVETFLLDNRLITPPVTDQESIQLLNQFSTIEKLAKLGDIKTVKILLEQIQVDDRIFTLDRKNKYLELINNHLSI
jgi:hypothetical protein